ncbi:hypothetical protein RCL1_004144 [Eukaryota sp. TZLM3-RCL]
MPGFPSWTLTEPAVDVNTQKVPRTNEDTLFDAARSLTEIANSLNNAANSLNHVANSLNSSVNSLHNVTNSLHNAVNALHLTASSISQAALNSRSLPIPHVSSVPPSNVVTQVVSNPFSNSLPHVPPIQERPVPPHIPPQPPFIPPSIPERLPVTTTQEAIQTNSIAPTPIPEITLSNESNSSFINILSHSRNNSSISRTATSRLADASVMGFSDSEDEESATVQLKLEKKRKEVNLKRSLKALPKIGVFQASLSSEEETSEEEKEVGLEEINGKRGEEIVEKSEEICKEKENFDENFVEDMDSGYTNDQTLTEREGQNEEERLINDVIADEKVIDSVESQESSSSEDTSHEQTIETTIIHPTPITPLRTPEATPSRRASVVDLIVEKMRESCRKEEKPITSNQSELPVNNDSIATSAGQKRTSSELVSEPDLKKVATEPVTIPIKSSKSELPTTSTTSQSSTSSSSEYSYESYSDSDSDSSTDEEISPKFVPEPLPIPVKTPSAPPTVSKKPPTRASLKVAPTPSKPLDTPVPKRRGPPRASKVTDLKIENITPEMMQKAAREAKRGKK